jgi:hypothetical protein
MIEVTFYFPFSLLKNSQDGKFGYGYASSPGKRSSMEDFYETRIDGVNGEMVGLFGVFDGIFQSCFMMQNFLMLPSRIGLSETTYLVF